MSREEFEKLEYIAEKMQYLYWCEYNECYLEKPWFRTCGLSAFVNGAWYTYQEQQKKIDEALKWLKIPHYGYTAAIASIGVAVRELEK